MIQFHKMKEILTGVLLFFITGSLSAQSTGAILEGTVKSGNIPLEYATIYVNNTDISTTSNKKGEFTLRVPPGRHIVYARYVGYINYEKQFEAGEGEKIVLHIDMREDNQFLDEVIVEAKSPVQRVQESAYNTVAVDAKALHNSSIDLAQAMAKVSGVRVRESGGLGSNVQFSLNGFTGRHVKFFMDGVPMEGMGASFQINNIPINIAERIEIYKGVVPVGFGGDAIGGAVNIVTNQRARTYVDVSYSYGSFNTHKTVINAGFTSRKEFLFEINAFQNYSDNSYWTYTSVKDLQTGAIDTEKIEKVKRFNDTYHNETIIGKIGVVNKPFADRLVFSLNIGKSYKDIQTGVLQNVVFGEKHNRTQTFMPSLVYLKKDLFTEGLNASLTANYNKNTRHNVDTAHYEYNWRGERKPLPENSRGGEYASYTDSKYENQNWNSTLNLTYRLNDHHSFVLNNVLSSFERNTRATPDDMAVVATDTMPKFSRKNILGLSYKISTSDRWNLSVFGKHYMQYVKGPRLVATGNPYTYDLFSETFSTQGYGIAGTYFLQPFQIKLSYEKAYRLPTDNELFGDEDQEAGSTGLKAENSDNYNLNVTFEKDIDKTHFFYLSGGFMLRNTKDYIRRRTLIRSGGVNYASHFNHGYVRNIGLDAEARYSFRDLVSAGANITSQDIRDREKMAAEKEIESNYYGVRLPNIPYLFGNGDISLFLKNFLKKGNLFTVSYFSNYVHEFPLRWENEGRRESKDWVPTQFSHDIQVGYSMENGRYNVSLECRNITDERLYDNFSLQKPGRAFYAKVRYFFNK